MGSIEIILLLSTTIFAIKEFAFEYKVGGPGIRAIIVLLSWALDLKDRNGRMSRQINRDFIIPRELAFNFLP